MGVTSDDTEASVRLFSPDEERPLSGHRGAGQGGCLARLLSLTMGTLRQGLRPAVWDAGPSTGSDPRETEDSGHYLALR